MGLIFGRSEITRGGKDAQPFEDLRTNYQKSPKKKAIASTLEITIINELGQ